MKEKTVREEYEKRLKKAFGKRWSSFSSERKHEVLDKLVQIHDEPELRSEQDIKQMLDQIQYKSFGVGTLMLGALLAVFVGLTVSILHDFFKGYGLWYQIIAPAGFFALLAMLSRTLENHITDMHRRNKTLDILLKLIKKKE